jgi:hypothetical protein
LFRITVHEVVPSVVVTVTDARGGTFEDWAVAVIVQVTPQPPNTSQHY